MFSNHSLAWKGLWLAAWMPCALSAATDSAGPSTFNSSRQYHTQFGDKDGD